VRVADSLDVWPERESREPTASSHVEATLEFASGPIVRLTASLYAPHRSREFYGLELHGDDGSLYLRGTGAMDTTTDDVQFGRTGRDYTNAPPQSPSEPYAYADALEKLAASVATGAPSRETGRRGAHVVAVCNAIEAAGEAGGPVPVSDHGATSEPVPGPVVAPSDRNQRRTGQHSIRLPPIGFGCSRYRDGEYVNREDSIATALDAGYRLLDSAELYGNEHRIGDLLAAPGSPDREHRFLIGKVWRTNHRREHLLEACAGSRSELGIDTFDCYMLHWPDAWAHRGRLDRLAEKPVDRQEELTFPEDDDGEIEMADIPLSTAWENLEAVHDRGWARTLGLCNVSQSQLETVLETGTVRPAVVQIERHPYQPRSDLVSFCHDRGIRVVAHSPLSASGLLDEPVLQEIAANHDLSPAGVVLAWNATQNVVPIPASTTPTHVVANLAAASERLSAEECARIAELQDSDFDR
jgi:alcohol dehydrogenase (NADP+)